MPKISELLFDRAEVTIPIENGELKVEFRPRALLPSWQEKIRQAEMAGEGDEAKLFAPIKDAVISWDLEMDERGEDGKPRYYPVTSEAMTEIPNAILTSVLLGLVAASRPNQQKVLSGSTVGSSAPATPEKRTRSGTS